MTVLDTWAVLAVIHDEPGADIVAAEVSSASLGTANLAEVVGKLIDADIDVSRVRELLAAAGVAMEPSRKRTRSWPAEPAMTQPHREAAR